MFTPESKRRMQDALQALKDAQSKFNVELHDNAEIVAKNAIIDLCRAIVQQDDEAQKEESDLLAMREALIAHKEYTKSYLQEHISNGLRWTSHPQDVIAALNKSIQDTKDLIAKK